MRFAFMLILLSLLLVGCGKSICKPTAPPAPQEQIDDDREDEEEDDD